MTLKRESGFSLLELMIVVVIGIIAVAVSVMALMPLLNESHVDNSYDTTLMALRNFRNLAITQRKQYIVQFAAPGTITVSYQGVSIPPAAWPPPVVVNTFTLPSDMQFAVQAGFPNTNATTPDNFGVGLAAIDFGQGLGLGSLSYVMFMPDGSARDNLGNNLNNGIVYLTRPGDLYSSRAVTVFGATGRIRGWRLYNQSGVNTWVQQ
jgi:type II secretory pathway pseudopilin PulG